jgi:hypothetical protein
LYLVWALKKMTGVHFVAIQSIVILFSGMTELFAECSLLRYGPWSASSCATHQGFRGKGSERCGIQPGKPVASSAEMNGSFRFPDTGQLGLDCDPVIGNRVSAGRHRGAECL